MWDKSDSLIIVYEYYLFEEGLWQQYFFVMAGWPNEIILSMNEINSLG
jgi:hypothetical protein